MRIIVISGGNIHRDFALGFLEKTEYDKIFVADKGMEFCRECEIVPDYIVGDFDSGREETVAYYTKLGVPIKRLRPEKDDTDTQSVLNLAKELGAKEVWILGATGTRLDHVFANIQLLAWGLKQGIEIELYDEHNYIKAADRGFTLNRAKQYGKYVSLFTMGDQVTNLTLRGFKYPLTNYCMKNTDGGLGVSNEILEETATVSFDEGMLLVIQSRD